MSQILDYPLRFEPFPRPMPWGGRALATLFGKDLPGNGPYGESWEVSDHPLHRSILATGERAGQTIGRLIVECRKDLLGSSSQQHAAFPWLIKLLDASDWLSV